MVVDNLVVEEKLFVEVVAVLIVEVLIVERTVVVPIVTVAVVEVVKDLLFGNHLSLGQSSILCCFYIRRLCLLVTYLVIVHYWPTVVLNKELLAVEVIAVLTQ